MRDPLRERDPVKFPTLLTLIGLCVAGPASAAGIAGTVIDTNGQPVWPCDIDIIDRATGQTAPVTNDSTLANGTFNITLADGRYDITFKPRKGRHLFQAEYLNLRLQGGTQGLNPILPYGKYFTGRVVDVNGAPVPFTNIRLKNAAGVAPAFLQDSNNNADGTFNVLTTAGIWNVEIVPALTSHKAPVLIPSVNLNNDVVVGDVAVPNGKVITCLVTDPNGFPLNNASITVRKLPGRNKIFIPSNNTAATGIARICVPDGSAYDVIAVPPPVLTNNYATVTQYNVTPTLLDQTLPTFTLPIARLLTGHVVDAFGAAVVNADLDVDWSQAPVYPRIETTNDFTNTLGNFTMAVPAGLQRLTIQPPVATKLLPCRLDSLTVAGTGLAMGNIVCRAGRWVDVSVVDIVTGLPIAGANINLYDNVTGDRLITIDNTTGATGSTRIVADDLHYFVKVNPPTAAWDTAYVAGGFRVTSDTTLTVYMSPKGVLGVGDRVAPTIRMASPWPNPARGTLNFSFAGRGEGELEILDLAGRRVATPWRGTASGDQTARWDGADEAGRRVASGVYFARLRVGAQTSVKRVVVAD